MKYFRNLSVFSLICCSLFLARNTPPKNAILSNNLVTEDSIFALYRYYSEDSLSGISIILKNNKHFYYNRGTDVNQSFSFGIWKIYKDTLYLVSSLNQHNIPIILSEKGMKSRDSLTIEMVKDLNGDVVKDAVVFINEDTINSCMPAFGECKFPHGVVKKIKITFSNNLTTSWQSLVCDSLTRIEPIVNVSFPLSNYLFFSTQKFLLRKKGLYQIREGGQIKPTRDSFLIKKIISRNNDQW